MSPWIAHLQIQELEESPRTHEEETSTFHTKSGPREAKKKSSCPKSRSQENKFKDYRRCEKRLRKIYSRQVEVWRQKALASWSKIEEKMQNREPLPKPLLCSFLDLKKVEILGISEWEMGLINARNLSSLKTNDVFCRKLATTRTSKYANLVKAFSNNQIPHECKIFRD